MNLAPEWREAARPPLPADEAALALCWERWRENAARSEDDDLIAFAEACGSDTSTNALLSALFGNSRYLSHCLTTDQGFARLLIEQGPRPLTMPPAQWRRIPASSATNRGSRR